MERFIKKNLWASLVSAVLLPAACEKEPVAVEPRLDFESADARIIVPGHALEAEITVEQGGWRIA